MAFPLPNGKAQFLDANGAPLAGGFVYHYIPATSTPKNTYQDISASILNTNPVVLDAAGEAVIFGTGAYRQVVTDSVGVQQWDQVTQVATLSTLGAVAIAGDTMTGELIAPSVQIPGGQLISVAPTGDPISTNVSLNIQGSTLSTTTREYLVSASLISNKRNGTVGTVSPTIAVYSGIQGQSGTSDIWAQRSVVVQDVSSGTYNAFGHEIDVANNVANRGETLGAAGLVAPVSYGMAMTGTGGFRATAAVLITGTGSAVWNRGITIAGNSVAQASFQDLGNATRSYEIQGSHTYGIDTLSATFGVAAMRLGNGQLIRGRNNANSADWIIAGYSGDNLFLGDPAATGIVMETTIIPNTDNAYTCGNNTNRWSAVWAVNGAIQTSDPTLKADITPLESLPAGTICGLIAGISPIHFRWISGGKDREGNDVPGKRVHWGWDAAQVRDAFAGTGIDFGGYVRGDDGRDYLRPDQLVPVLWQAVKSLTARVAALEARP